MMRIESSKNLLVAVVNQMYPAAVVLNIAIGDEIDRTIRRHREMITFKFLTTDVNKRVRRQRIVLQSGESEKIRFSNATGRIRVFTGVSPSRVHAASPTPRLSRKNSSQITPCHYGWSWMRLQTESPCGNITKIKLCYLCET